MVQEVYRHGDIKGLQTFIGQFASDEVLLVRGKGSYAASGAQTFVENELDLKDTTSFYDFSVNPKIEDVRKGVELFRKGNYQFIVAIGGGSVLDMAKLISVMVHQPEEDIPALIEGIKSLQPKKAPLLAIPTTAGTGAEATHFAVVYMGEKKYSLSSPEVLPNAVFLSPAFLKAASPYLMASTGIDAFAQAMESVWSVNATAQSLGYAYQAVELIWHNLPMAVKGEQGMVLERMMEGSFLAGKSINISKTTAPHAISYAFTTYYGLPHGHAVALSLPFFLNYNFNVDEGDCTDPKGVEEVKKRMAKLHQIMGVQPQEALDGLKSFIVSIGLEMSIGKLAPNFQPHLIIDNVNTERLNNNPRRVTKNIVTQLINEAI